MKRTRPSWLTALACIGLLATICSPTTLYAQSALELTNKAAVAERLQKEGQLLIYYPAGSNFKKWLTDTLVAGFEKYVKTTYGVDLQVALLSTGGGDAAFWQKYEAFKKGGGKKGEFDIDVVRVAPDAKTLSAIDQGLFMPLLPDNKGLLPNVLDINKPGLATFTTNDKTYAAPFYQPTISLFYNKEKLPNPPKSLEALAAYVKQNPKRFTYEDPRSSSGIGSGTMWLLAVMKHYGDVDDPASWTKGWAFLKELQPNTFPQPNTGEQALELMRRGEIDLMAFWNDWGLSAKDTLKMPFMENYLLDSGLPVRNTPLAVPADTRHPTAALLFINWASSAAMQSSLAKEMHQIPANISATTWQQIPKDAFGFEYPYITERTFPSFNSRKNIAAISTLAEGWSSNVLGR